MMEIFYKEPLNRNWNLEIERPETFKPITMVLREIPMKVKMMLTISISNVIRKHCIRNFEDYKAIAIHLRE